MHRLFADRVLGIVRELLSVQAKHVRIEACNGILAIAKTDPGFGLQIIDDLIDSLCLADDDFGENGSAESWAQRALARIMMDHPEKVDERIQQRIWSAREDVQSALFGIYDWVLRPADLDESKEAGTDVESAHRLAYQRFVEVLARRTSGKTLTTAIWFLRDYATRFPDLLERHAETLLGAAALIAADLEAPYSQLLDLDVRPDVLKSIEEQGRRLGMSNALDALAKVIGVAAARKPASVGSLVVQTFESLDDTHSQLKAALVTCLGTMAGCKPSLPMALPPLYQAMTSQAVLVRGAAAESYASFAGTSADDLPSLVHESFLLLLRDPFVYVHSRAVACLLQVSLPSAYLARVKAAVLNLVIVY